jgi:hypothetical protein
MPTTAQWKRPELSKGQEGLPFQYDGYLLSDLTGTYPYEYVSTTVTWTEVTD